MPGEPAARAVELLRNAPGIVGVREVRRAVLEEVASLEERYGRTAFLPVLNLGVRAALRRGTVLAVLKDRRFRPPPAPTVYLVEELDAAGPESEVNAARREARVPALEVDGRRFRVLGEEVLDAGQEYAERTMFLGDSFVVFPERRSGPKTPSYFLVPPLGFQELEQAAAQLGIGAVMSVSPSAQADGLLRRACGFPEDPGLATLLVGFDALG